MCILTRSIALDYAWGLLLGFRDARENVVKNLRTNIYCVAIGFCLGWFFCSRDKFRRIYPGDRTMLGYLLSAQEYSILVVQFVLSFVKCDFMKLRVWVSEKIIRARRLIRMRKEKSC